MQVLGQLEQDAADCKIINISRNMSIRQSVKRCFPFIVPIYQYFKYGQWGSMDKWPEEALIKADMMYYKQTLRYKFDLNNPVTFTEKIQWYKFFYEHPDINRITDKVRFKEYGRQQKK